MWELIHLPTSIVVKRGPTFRNLRRFLRHHTLYYDPHIGGITWELGEFRQLDYIAITSHTWQRVKCVKLEPCEFEIVQCGK